MKNVLYINLKFNNHGQRRMDENIIRELSKDANVTVVCPDGWYSNEIDGAHYEHFEAETKIKNYRLSEIVKNAKIIKYANRYRRKHHIDCFFFASYDTLVFPLWKLLARSTLSNCYIVQNNNIDGVINSKKKCKRWIFNFYSRKVNHIVLEGFIGDFIEKEFSIPRNKINLLPHPLNSNECSSYKDYDCVGISNSNDDEWIKKIIDIEINEELFAKNQCKVVLRSTKYSYDDGWLCVFNGWLDDKKYNDYINRAKRIFLPYPQTFRYRMSGSVVDAFSNHTSVIGSDIPLFLYYSDKYGDICQIVRKPEDLFDVVLKEIDNDQAANSFVQFIDEHSKKVVRESLIKALDL